jgi:transcriptional regulator GlxA family with amidase domain
MLHPWVHAPPHSPSGKPQKIRPKRRSTTTHWAAFDLLKYFGATPVDERVVIDGSLVSTAGVTAGIDGALRVTALFLLSPVAALWQKQRLLQFRHIIP